MIKPAWTCLLKLLLVFCCGLCLLNIKVLFYLFEVINYSKHVKTGVEVWNVVSYCLTGLVSWVDDCLSNVIKTWCIKCLSWYMCYWFGWNTKRCKIEGCLHRHSGQGDGHFMLPFIFMSSFILKSHTYPNFMCSLKSWRSDFVKASFPICDKWTWFNIHVIKREKGCYCGHFE